MKYHEITDFHNAIIERYRFLFALELPKVAFLQLQFAVRQYSQSRFTIFVAADPAILAGLGDHLLHHGVFSVAQMFLQT